MASPRLPRIIVAEPIRLALEGEHGALDLLVVLELDLEEADQLDGDSGRAGDADRGELVGLKDLFDVALGDEIAHRRAPVAGHHDAARMDDGHDRRARAAPPGRPWPAAVGNSGSRSGAADARKSVNEALPALR